MNLSHYRIGLVISKAGLNHAQTQEIRKRLQRIARMGGPEVLAAPMTIAVPNCWHMREDGVKQTLAPISWMRALPYANVEVLRLEHDEEIIHYFQQGQFDEVWCCPAANQSESIEAKIRAKPWKIYERGRELDVRKYKIIPPWVEPEEETRAQKKPKRQFALKGW